MMPAPAMKPIIEVAVKKPAHHEHVDQNQHGCEGEAKVAKDLDGDVPFAVPLHRVVVSRFRLHRVVARKRVSGWERKVVERLVHFENRVHRALLRAGHIAGYIHHATQILVIDAGLDRLVLNGDEFAQRHHTPVRSRQANALQCLFG